MDRFLSCGHGVSVPLLGLAFSCVVELLALAVGHNFDVTAAVSANEDTAAVGAESVTRGIRDKFKGLVAAGRASVAVEGAACCITYGVIGHHSTSCIQNSRQHSLHKRPGIPQPPCLPLCVTEIAIGHMSNMPVSEILASGHCSRNAL